MTYTRLADAMYGRDGPANADVAPATNSSELINRS